MATFNKINDFVQHIANAEVNLGSDQLVVALSNTAPSSETNDPTADGNGTLSNVTQIDYTHCSSRNVTTSSSTQTGGTYKLVCNDLTITASGGDVGPFRYVYLYDDTSTGDYLIGYYDYGESITLHDGDSFTIDFDQTNGVITIS